MVVIPTTPKHHEDVSLTILTSLVFFQMNVFDGLKTKQFQTD